MIDPRKAEKLDLSTGAWKVLMTMACTTSNLGFVDITLDQIADRQGMALRTVKRHVAGLKNANVIVRQKNKNGRVKFRINPEYIWDYKLSIRNELVTDIRHAKLLRNTA